MKFNIHLIKALIFSAIIIVIANVFLLYDGPARRIGEGLGGNLSHGGYIQFMTYVAFFWVMAEIRIKQKKIFSEKTILTQGILPEKENYVIYKDEINEFRKKMSEYEKQQGVFYLTNLVKQACIKYIRSTSISEVIDLVSKQSSIDQEREEASQSVIKYLLWAMPSLGFIGTVLGIAEALGHAGKLISGDQKAAMDIITLKLGMAFDTTLVALVLSVISMWFFHSLQEEQENLHSDIEQYVINNFINRIAVE